MAASLLAVDLDGTLLARSGVAHEVDVRALRAARRAGVTVTLITGRLFPGTRPTAALLQLDDALGCGDGSHLVHTSGDTLEYTSLRGPHLTALREAMRATRVTAYALAKHSVVHDEAGEAFLDYVRTWTPEVERTHDVLEHGVWEQEHGLTAVVGLAEESPIATLVGDIRARLGAAAHVLSFPLGKTGLHGFLARTPQVDKGTALHFLARRANVAREDTVVVGDWLNDVPMFRAAGRSFCMGQAPADVKAAATHVLDETAERGGGIAAVVREHFGVRF